MKIAVFDIETDGLLDEATVVWCIAIREYKDNAETRLFKQNNIKEALLTLSEYEVICGHNIDMFDIPVLKKLYNYSIEKNQKTLDTLLLSRILYPKRPPPVGYKTNKPHSLECFGERYGIKKQEHEDWTKYSNEMGKRCIQDVKINTRVLKELGDDTTDLQYFIQFI